MFAFIIGFGLGIVITVGVQHRDVLLPEIKRLFGK